MHTNLEQHPAEMAAGHVLKSIARRPGSLLEVLQQLRLVALSGPDDEPLEVGFDIPELDARQRTFMAERLTALHPEALAAASRYTGVPVDRILRPLAEQLRHVAMFATSDGGAIDENVRAVEGMLRTGRVELFAAA